MNVTDEQLLEDIHNTELEVDAYYNLETGFLVLANLPENINTPMSSNYLHEHYKYNNLGAECCIFLYKLYRIKANRGI